MGAFDDLIPQSSGGGTFDDLIPKQKTQADFQKEVLDEMPWAQRQVVGFGGAMAKGLEGIRSMIPGQTADQDVVRAADVAGQEAPIGSMLGEIAKYAPVALAGTAVLPAAAASAALGAAYDPTGHRMLSAATEGAFGAGGALIGKALPRVIGGTQNTYNRVRDLFRDTKSDRFYGATDKASEAAKRIIGGADNEAAASRMLGEAGDVTTAQALEGLPNSGGVAVLDKITRSDKGIRAAVDPIAVAEERAAQMLRQSEGRNEVMERMARGSTAEDTAIARKTFMDAQEAALGPVRAAELSKAGVGRTIPELEQQAAKLEYEAMVHGGTSAKAAELRGLADQIRGAGYSPLNVGGVKNRIAEILGDPKLGSSVNVEDVVSSVSGRISELVKRGGGVIDPDALYMVRKEGVNEAIDKLLAGRDPAMTKRLSAKLSAELKPLIDDAIENSGGTGWKSYIEKYGAAFDERGKLELADTLRQLQVDNPKTFLKVMQGNDPDLVAKYGNWDTIKQALGEKRFDRASKVAGEIQRDRNIKEAAKSKEYGAAVKEVLENKSLTKHLPNLLNRYVALGNAAIDRGEMEVNKMMYRELEQAMRTPSKMKALIDRLPPEERSKFINYAMKLGKGAPTAAAAYGEQVRK